jgi:hypothetical protein
MSERRQQLIDAIARAIDHLRAQGRTSVRSREILTALEELGLASALQLSAAHLNALGDAAGKAGLGLEKGRTGYVIPPAVIPNGPALAPTPALPVLSPPPASDLTGGTGADAKSGADAPAEAERVTLEFVQNIPPERETAKAGLEVARTAADPAKSIF